MPGKAGADSRTERGIDKTATRIQGLDEILHGGIPTGRVTLVSGGPGAGKSILGQEFLYRGALAGHPGIFVSFEESAECIRQNVGSFGWDIETLESAGKLFLLEGLVPPEAAISGDFNLKGFLAIIEGKAVEMGAKRIVIDALDVLMSIFGEPRKEYQQTLALHRWLNRLRMTVVLTTKKVYSAENISPYHYLDFMSDCVICLEQRIRQQVNTKRLQVIKYRGSGYGANEYPFLITDKGMFFNTVSQMQLNYSYPSTRMSSGSRALDEFLGGGYQAGTCILISGSTGTGKTALASTFARSASKSGQKVLYINYEESVEGMLAGVGSIGIDLRGSTRDGSLRIVALMPESRGVEEHLYHIVKTVSDFEPDHLVIDAISAGKRIAGDNAAFDFIMRIIHFCKQKGITAVLINQSESEPILAEISGIGISSVIDTVIVLYYKDIGNETGRILKVVKSRGSRHSNKYHSFALSGSGLQFGTRQAEKGL
jgi:circadian clock protein KaiC